MPLLPRFILSTGRTLFLVAGLASVAAAQQTDATMQRGDPLGVATSIQVSRAIALLKSDLRNLTVAQEAYFTDHGRYANSLDELGRELYEASQGTRLRLELLPLPSSYIAVAESTLPGVGQSCLMKLGTRENDDGIPICKPRAEIEATWVRLVSSATRVAPPLPRPTGWVSDFANVIASDEEARITQIVEQVRAGSRGEIAVVTLPDLAGREVGAVALAIGREWGVGASASVGDRARNAGVVVLLVPRETSQDGSGHISIQVGQGAERFISDATAENIRLEATSQLRAGAYGPALAVIITRIAERYAAEFGFMFDSPPPTRYPRPAMP